MTTAIIQETSDHESVAAPCLIEESSVLTKLPRFWPQPIEDSIYLFELKRIY